MAARVATHVLALAGSICSVGASSRWLTQSLLTLKADGGSSYFLVVPALYLGG